MAAFFIFAFPLPYISVQPQKCSDNNKCKFSVHDPSLSSTVSQWIALRIISFVGKTIIERYFGSYDEM